MNDKIRILSVEFPIMSKAEARERAALFLDAPTGAKIFTPNPQMLLAAKKDPSFSAILNSAELLLPDGVGIKIASHLQKKPIPERIAGIDAAYWILEKARERGLSVYLLGGKPQIASRAAEELKKALPDLNIRGTHHGYFDKRGEENMAVVSEIRKAAPDILFVCFGAPAQERWICENIASLPSVRIAMGLGGSLDVWSGNAKRAPRLVQALCLEWLWRASREPKRLKIFIEIPQFLYFSIRER